jgi:hypothetical protein
MIYRAVVRALRLSAEETRGELILQPVIMEAVTALILSAARLIRAVAVRVALLHLAFHHHSPALIYGYK